MILIPIFLALFTGLMILRLFDQYKFLNLFEQIVLGFFVALSLFVFELFIGGLVFGKLSLILPILSFIIVLGFFVYKIYKKNSYINDIKKHLSNDFQNIKEQFNVFQLRKKILFIFLGLYALVKIIMVFQISTNMPTYDEDAVAGWDLKTKIFSENKSLVLDRSNPEYFGMDYGRYPFAGIVDTYFLLPYGGFVNGLSNIISPISYLLSILLLFGIFLRKTSLFTAIVVSYIFTSLPFVFIHGLGSYRNFPSGLFLFIFSFYLIDQLFNLEKDYGSNKNILIPVLLIGLISSSIRNEGVMLTGICFLLILASYHFIKKQKLQNLKFQLRPILPAIVIYIVDKIIFSFYPKGVSLNTGGSEVSTNLINSFFENISKPGVFAAPFKQMFLHPDYLLLFPLMIVSTIIILYNYKKNKDIRLITIVTFVLLFLFMFNLYANLESLGLITHFAFIRYPVSILLFIIYISVYAIYISYNKGK